jgi:hypothetical protein
MHSSQSPDGRKLSRLACGQGRSDEQIVGPDPPDFGESGEVAVEGDDVGPVLQSERGEMGVIDEIPAHADGGEEPRQIFGMGRARMDRNSAWFFAIP